MPEAPPLGNALSMDFGTVFVILLGALAASVALNGLDRKERRYASLAFVAHIVASFAQWAIVEFYYGISDVHVYQSEGLQLARLLDLDLVHFAPEVAKLALHMQTSLPFEAYGDGSSTGTMSAIAGCFSFAAGPAPLTLYVLASQFSWYGLLCWYRLARAELPADDRTMALIGLMGVPSVVFWSAGFVKEALVIGFLGILGFSTYRVVRSRNVLFVVGIIFGGVGVAVLKSYTLFAFFIALAAFVYADRAWRAGGPIRIRPAYLVLTGAIAIGGVAAMGALFPEYSAGSVAGTMAYNQEVWRQGTSRGEGGGSSVDMGSGDATTMTGQLQFVPLALVNALFRPVIFEARNGPALAGALENAGLVVALFALAFSGARKAVRDAIFRVPFIFASIAFVLVFGTGVALATSNLGTLSRYRVTMMPFYATSVLLLVRRGRSAVIALRAAARPLVRVRPRPSRAA